MTSLSERTTTLVSRLSDSSRQLQEVALVLVDGTEIHGVLHRAHGTRTLDYLNRQAETFVAMTDAVMFRGTESEHVPFVAINKSHIVRVIEAAEAG